MATHSSVLAWRIPGTGGALWAAVSGVAQSQTQLKRLSSSSSSVANRDILVTYLMSKSSDLQEGKFNPKVGDLQTHAFSC